MERKVVPSYVKSIEGRNVAGIFAVHGVVDYVLDRSWPGSFTKTIQEGMQTKAIKYLWSHNMDWGASGPPTAVVVDIKEVPREELPPELLQRFPEASGGVQVTRKYLNTQRGDEVFQGLVEGAITEQSYGFDPVKVDYTPTQTDAGMAQIRELRENKLWEVSDVLWGANPATIASKGLAMLESVIWTPEAGMALGHIKAIMAGLHQLQQKSGARHSKEDRALIKSIHNMVVDLEPSICKGKAESDADDKEEADGASDKEGKGQPGAGGGASTAGAMLPPLWSLKQQLELLELGL